MTTNLVEDPHGEKNLDATEKSDATQKSGRVVVSGIVVYSVTTPGSGARPPCVKKFYGDSRKPAGSRHARAIRCIYFAAVKNTDF